MQPATLAKNQVILSTASILYDLEMMFSYPAQTGLSRATQLDGYQHDTQQQGCFRVIDNKVISYNDLMVPESYYPIWQEWKRVLAKRLPFTYEYQIITKEGVRKWVLELGEGVFDDDGHVIALEGIIVDDIYLNKWKKRFATTLTLMRRPNFITAIISNVYLIPILNKDEQQIKRYLELTLIQSRR